MFLWKYSTYLIKNYDNIYIEDLDVKGLLEKKVFKDKKEKQEELNNLKSETV